MLLLPVPRERESTFPDWAGGILHVSPYDWEETIYMLININREMNIENEKKRERRTCCSWSCSLAFCCCWGGCEEEEEDSPCLLDVDWYITCYITQSSRHSHAALYPEKNKNVRSKLEENASWSQIIKKEAWIQETIPWFFFFDLEEEGRRWWC